MERGSTACSDRVVSHALNGSENTVWSDIETENCATVQVELLIKLIGLGWKEYWASNWNKLDIFLVALSVLDLALSYLQSSFLRIIKVLKAQKLLRLLRVTRMAKALKTLRSIFHLLIAIQRSVAAILQVFALVVLIFFMFAYVGVLLFGSVKRG
jgi:hypothetical protein